MTPAEAMEAGRIIHAAVDHPPNCDGCGPEEYDCGRGAALRALDALLAENQRLKGLLRDALPVVARYSDDDHKYEPCDDQPDCDACEGERIVTESRAALGEEVGEAREVMLESAGPGTTRDGDPAFAMRLLPPRDVVLHIAEAMAAMLDGAQAQNYIEMEVQHRTRGTFILCIQRASGLSPHRLRQQAEAERDETRAELEKLKAHVVEEQEIAHRCQAICGECTGRCGIPDDEREGGAP